MPEDRRASPTCGQIKRQCGSSRPLQSPTWTWEGSAELRWILRRARRARRSTANRWAAEQVGAYHCDKYRVQATLEGKVYTSLEWDAKELDGFPVKQAYEKGGWSQECQNVKLGPQDASLFEVPADYKKIDLGGLFSKK